MTRCAIVALTRAGLETAKRVKEGLPQLTCQLYTLPRLVDDTSQPLLGSPVQALAQLFGQVEVLICIMATGIVVRSLAPVIADKTTDPAVLVLDEKGQHVISLLSGHLGGANQLTLTLAESLGACPVITTATDVQGVVALDTLAQSVNGWRDDLRPLVKVFNAYLAAHEPVYFYQEQPWVKELKGLTVVTEADKETYLASEVPMIYLSRQPLTIKRKDLALIYPKPYVLGVGARKGVASDVFRIGFELFCQRQGIFPREISKIVSLDLKKDEIAIVQLAESLQIPFETYNCEQLAAVADKYPQSSFVRATVGVGSVALASADVASHGKVMSERFAREGCTYALGSLID